MGLLDGLMGNASEITPERVAQEYSAIFAEGERVQRGYQLVRDVFFFTDRRLVIVNKQGITGSKVSYQSIPYRSITRFSVETAGNFDLDAELKVWVSGGHEPIGLQFNKKVNVYQVQALLAGYVTK